MKKELLAIAAAMILMGAVWFPALSESVGYGVMMAEDGQSEDGKSLLIEAEETDLPVYLEIMTQASIGMSSWKFPDESVPANAQFHEDKTETGMEIRWFQRPSAYNSEILESHYAVQDGENGLMALGTWPENGSEMWEEMFTSLMRSIRFTPALPIRADWAEATPNAYIVDEENGDYITIMADEPITNVALLSLNFMGMNDHGQIIYQTEVLCERDSITPDSPLVQKIAFSGDIPSYGLRFTNIDAKERQVELSISGKDGSPVMREF